MANIAEINKEKLIAKLEYYKTMVEGMDAECLGDAKVYLQWSPTFTDQWFSDQFYTGTGAGSIPPPTGGQ